MKRKLIFKSFSKDLFECSTELKIFQTMKELTELDEKVNQFIADHGIEDVVSVSDCATSDNSGMTMGLIRTLTYRE
ncbi:MAG: hypothetical protein ACE5I8_04530 [Thermodesulfobacteriota bacterium]